MIRRLLLAGALGACVLILWAFVANALLGLRGTVDMKRVSNESQVYDVLRENIAEPGGYMVNPPLTQSGVFPAREPVFGVHYGGIGHEAAGQMLLFELAIAVIASMIAAGMLLVTSPRIISSYFRRVLFFMAVGLLFAVFRDLALFNIGGLPIRSALLLAANALVSWTLVGLVVAKWIRPRDRDVATAGA